MSEFDLRGIGMTSQRTRDRLVARLREQGIEHPGVLDAMASTPRHIFIDEALSHRAYEDTALPIGHGQTISQPLVVALMTATLLNEVRGRVLELGTGSGYQTAILSALCQRVFSIERVEPLMQRARLRFDAMGLPNVVARVGDGYRGWPEQAPFSGILVTAAPRSLPDTLLEQLEVGGRMIVPVGDGGMQELKVIDRTEDGYVETVVEYVRFVPMLKGVRTS
ncbi:MAG: protein-L-isoaspartate(D-aspartate) O-methyltransferase [Pseudomonadales bacterium]|nr:protein-L-isoaspartate(D-aspartate) O-methyltransferase [Pseudomonadales bacterium]MDP6471719.1 protein-L-isoaspartate(D-aspartate) O-methyltransferase [Pseudomonadales bacterium]MDP6971449.1 protein-L-isoaspartate(D-aspartate) O-methyltransferase [Pseudomonadales bacterium]